MEIIILELLVCLLCVHETCMHVCMYLGSHTLRAKMDGEKFGFRLELYR